MIREEESKKRYREKVGKEKREKKRRDEEESERMRVTREVEREKLRK